LGVIGVGGGIKVLQVTTNAIGAGNLEIPTDVARRAIEADMYAGEHETGELSMIEVCSEPTVHGMADLTRGWELRRLVAWQSRLDEVLAMAGNALGGEPGELAGSHTFVAIVTSQARVSTQQWESVLMAADRAQ
jgi:hypothetical protein